MEYKKWKIRENRTNIGLKDELVTIQGSITSIRENRTNIGLKADVADIKKEIEIMEKIEPI